MKGRLEMRNCSSARLAIGLPRPGQGVRAQMNGVLLTVAEYVELDPAPVAGIDDLAIKGNALNMLLAGEDTTANTLAWMIHLLWRNPDKLARATEEVRRLVADPARAGFEDVARLDYVEACAHETMRLKPVAPLLPVQTLRETTIGDVRVPASIVVFNLMRRDSVSEAHVPRPLGFEPERWLVEGAAGVALAGFLRERPAYARKNVAVVLCGRNISPEKAAKIWKMGS